MRTLLSASVAFLILGSATMAVAQDFSLDEYLELQTAADDAYDALIAIERDDANFATSARDAVALRIDLVEYLNAWSTSGSMPDGMSDDARETRVVLYQNIVRIFADLETCSRAREMLTDLEFIIENEETTPTMREAFAEARAVTSECEFMAELNANANANNAVVVAPPVGMDQRPVRSNAPSNALLIVGGVAIAGFLATEIATIGARDVRGEVEDDGCAVDSMGCPTTAEYDRATDQTEHSVPYEVAFGGIGLIATTVGLIIRRWSPAPDTQSTAGAQWDLGFNGLSVAW